MTLREELIKLNLRTPNPPVLGNMQVKGILDCCPFGLKDFFSSMDFVRNLDDLLLDLQEGCDHGYSVSEFYLTVYKNSDGKYRLLLNLEPYDCSEQEQ